MVIKRRMFKFESLCSVVLPLRHDITGITDQDTYLPARLEHRVPHLWEYLLIEILSKTTPRSGAAFVRTSDGNG
jgi:hypothetical protein